MLAVLESLYGCAGRTVTVGQLPAAEHGHEVWTQERRVWQDTEAPDHVDSCTSADKACTWGKGSQCSDESRMAAETMLRLLLLFQCCYFVHCRLHRLSYGPQEWTMSDYYRSALSVTLTQPTRLSVFKKLPDQSDNLSTNSACNTYTLTHTPTQAQMNR